MGEKMIKIQVALIVSSLLTAMISTASIGAVEAERVNDEIQPIVVQQFFEEAKKNNNWKTAFVTGIHEQIVFMNISPLTNPKNEIGKEVHPFDQVIVIVEGSGKALMNEKTSLIKAGDMIFIPKGTQHNVINLDQKNGLKLISFYSATDIPKDTVYKKKADEPQD